MKKLFLKFVTFDDIRVKHKLMFLTLSVVIPIFITNIIYYYNISKSVREQQTIFLRETLQGVKVNVTRMIEDCIRITDIYYFDNKLSILLSNNYTNQNEYYRVHTSDLEDYINKYKKLYNQVYELNFYVTNKSIVSGRGYYYIDDKVENTDWYRNFVFSNSNIYVDAYIDENSYSSNEKIPIRYFSIIRKLDNLIYGGEVKKIIKVDVDYNYINKIIDSEGISAEIYIVNSDNNIIFSNNPKYGNFSQEFVSFEAYEKKPKTLIQSEKMTGILEGYKVIIVAPKTLVIHRFKNSNINLAILTLINLVFPSIIILLISRSFKNRIEILSHHMQNINQDKYILNLVDCRQGTDEIGQLIHDFNHMAVRMDELIKDVYEASIKQKNLEIAKKQAELNALQSQINPHFLFNTLETIRMRSLLKEEIETSSIIKILSKMLRRALNWGNDLVAITEELAFTEDFLKIQMYRFEDKLRYNIYVEEKFKNYRIPKLSIMTLVENACIHGIENVATIGTVDISVKGMDNLIKIIVKDDGIGMSQEKVNILVDYLKNEKSEEADSSHGIGIKNVYNRLKMIYGDKFGFYIKSIKGKGTEIEISIPYDV
jgi:two-component system, sensor histidine kinase YesM